jgi:hypothetical protein
LLAVGLVSFIAKDNLTDNIKQFLKTYRINYTPEKVYVQLDKPYYIAGETIWLKAYLTDASTHQPISQSGVLYVDLMEENNQPSQRLKLKVEDGIAKGNIDLPDSLEAGNYRLSAYTNWMRNFGEETFFNRSIRIWNAGEEIRAAQTETQEIPEVTEDALVDLQFFPESGDMVAGIPAEVAFKAIDQQGLGVPVKGFVMDGQGKKIIDFHSFHLGMGAFKFTPEAGVQYMARLIEADGAVRDYPLPEVSSRGYVLSVEEYQDENVINIRVQGSDDQQTADLLLTGISQNELVYSENIRLNNTQYETSIAKKGLPTGIVRFTLFDPQGEPYAERLAFVRPENQLQLTISTNEPEFLPREQVRMTIEAKDTEGNPASANLTLAVTDQEVVSPIKNDETIASYLLLTSDLTGYVQQPVYYFQDVNDSTKQALRHVMMTHGWRRFAWKDAVAGQYPDIKFTREKDLSIDGKLVNQKGDPVKGSEMILYVRDQHQTFIVSETDDQGNFSFNGFDFTDSVDLVIQGTTADGKRNVEVKIDEEDFVPPAPGWQIPQADQLLASTNRAYIDVSAQRIEAEDTYRPRLRDIVLKEIVVEDRVAIIEPMKLHHRADQVLRPQDLTMPPPSGNILESLQGRVAGLQIYRSGWNEFRATIRGYGEPLYLLDGMPINASTVSALNPWDIDRVEILKGPEAAIYGGRASGGIIAFFTKRGGVAYEEVEPGKHIIIHRAGGFSKTREFYAPRYTASNIDQEKPDLRTTIHWEPNLQTGADGKAEVTFYTADRATTYRAVLEGITPDGLPGSQIFTFDVVKPEDVDVGK